LIALVLTTKQRKLNSTQTK